MILVNQVCTHMGQTKFCLKIEWCQSSTFILNWYLTMKYYLNTTDIVNKTERMKEWFTAHEQQCQKNYDGSSPDMEGEGWKRLWKRSIEKCKFPYRTVVSDGDSKAHTAIVREKECK